MKNITALTIALFFVSFAGLSCKNPLTAYTKQYRCELPGQPEPTTADEYIDRAYKHGAENNYKADPGGCALGACSEALRLDPKNPSAYYCRAQVLTSMGQGEKALPDIDEAIRLKPDFGLAYLTRGTIKGELRQLEPAIADMTRGMELLGDDVAYFHYSRRGGFYFQSEKYEEALKDFNKAIELRPENELNYTDRAQTYDKLGKTDLAAADRKKAAELRNDEEIDKDTGPADVKTGDSRTISGGVLNEKAITLPQPPYPPTARAVRAAGSVTVNIEVDTKGDVVKAEAISGHPLLKAAAVTAARQAKFKPGPSPVSGSLVFNFKGE
jgi:TonB family protein